MNIQERQPSAYAPTKPDPLRLASVTIQAVDRIGAATSEEIEMTADEIMRGATEIAEKLRELARAISDHSKIANEHVAGFCEKATSVFEGVRDLQQKLEVNGREYEMVETSDEILEVPAFLSEVDRPNSRMENSKMSTGLRQDVRRGVRMSDRS